MSWEGFISDKLKARQYLHKTEAKKDLATVLKNHPDLHPEEDIYVQNDGTTKTYISLKGTIPVNYKGAIYNIPIQIWVLTGHPFTAPLVYVRPTSTMVIKPSKHVDQAGRVYMPFLTEWRSPKSDTMGMISMLQLIFSQECPVYAKPPSGPTTRPPPPQVRPHQPGYPGHQQGPGYPTQQGGMPMPGMPSSYGGYPGQQNYPTHQPTAGVAPYPTSQAQSPYPSVSAYQPPQRPAPPTNKLPERQGSVIAEEHLRASLLSTAEDKLKRRVKEVFQMGKIELNGLQQTQIELEKGNQELNDMVRKMNDEKANLASNISLLTQKNKEMEEALRKLESDSENMDIDEAVVTTAPLFNQILNLFAEENAVEDAIYYLSDALRREVIELEVFLKTVRTLSRKQFMLRATLQKARATAGLPSNAIGH
ncbi:tumor susceptibility gene 101 protein-like isoform X1 [Hydractinia symbiolongicarpus]|uniref:tumor susceptibility gene 101 protein-like isoform X1 n=1 Tax=Hydractinia symbiolongicarpus TaxID=13093 RepID=UPI00254B25AE|nr:tumor susceptibility gene 101 protein-like isoform X1 [Hydractinia symbiolongicarpus]